MYSQALEKVKTWQRDRIHAVQIQLQPPFLSFDSKPLPDSTSLTVRNGKLRCGITIIIQLTQRGIQYHEKEWYYRLDQPDQKSLSVWVAVHLLACLFLAPTTTKEFFLVYFPPHSMIRWQWIFAHPSHWGKFQMHSMLTP